MCSPSHTQKKELAKSTKLPPSRENVCALLRCLIEEAIKANKLNFMRVGTEKEHAF